VLHELKLIVDLINQGGLTDMHYSISNTAEYGDLTRGPRVINDNTKTEMKKILKEIQNGTFAKEFIDEINSGSKNFDKLRKQIEEHQIEKVGKTIRTNFSWGSENKIIDREKN
ncbi:MAG TPA: hypothetical protein PLG15_07140, partial [Candidatus Gastranaerophilaceae bacterium]|nr:hypothetical protein [Candidatus Gastranaerophilaceae bacterium]